MEVGIFFILCGKVYAFEIIWGYYRIVDKLEEYDFKLIWNIIDMKFYCFFMKWCNEKDWSLNYIG